ncbi:MAG: CidA/LrgA family protein [Parvibaculum sp.]|uniref:CidA/LrgA family protein n=1 Tax=Parvibaculum sp. TaxID=2024848 RepID=UPI003C7494DC
MNRRRIISWAVAFLALVACNEAGRLIAAGLHLPVPGTVIGLLILLAALLVMRRVPTPLREMTVFLLAHLNLFYVPAGVGVMAYLALVRQDLWPIIVALFLSTFLATLAAGLAFHWTAKFVRDDESGT